MCVIIFKIKNKLMLVCHPLFKNALCLEGGNPKEGPETTELV